MKLAASNPIIIDFDPFNTSTVQQHDLGTEFKLSDDRSFRYSLAGAANLSAGKCNTAPVQKTNHMNVAVQAAAAIGATSVSLTLGATAALANEYAEGLLVVGLTPGQGHSYKISSNPANAGSLTITVPLLDPIQVALTTSSKASLVHNVSNGTVEGTVQTIRPSGVTMTPVTAANYYFGQIHGVASTLNDGAIALGSWVTLSSSVSGAVAAMSATYGTALLTPRVGEMRVKVGVDTQYEPVFLDIA